MPHMLKRPLSVALGALSTLMLGGCYYGDVYGASYASAGACSDGYSDYDPYAYDNGYGYGCYDPADYGRGFVQIGFGGGWYDDYYYPGYGLWMFDRYRNRYPLRGSYLNYWGGRRAWWKHHRGRGDGHWRGDGRRGDRHEGRHGRWRDRDGDRDRPRGTRPRRDRGDGDAPPAARNPTRPDRGRGDTVITPRRPPAATRPAPVTRPAPAVRPRPADRADRLNRTERNPYVRED